MSARRTESRIKVTFPDPDAVSSAAIISHHMKQKGKAIKLRIMLKRFGYDRVPCNRLRLFSMSDGTGHTGAFYLRASQLKICA